MAGDRQQLQELHDAYVWEVNAAVGENRLDLVWQLADDYLTSALALITAEEAPVCDRPDCAVCGRSRPAPRPRRRRGWRRLRARPR